MTININDQDPLFTVAGKVALITGGTSGIGQMMAAGLVARGARVYITARNAEDCAAVVQDLSKSGDCHAITGDVSTINGVERLAEAFEKQEQHLNILVHAAGLHLPEPIDSFSEKSWDDTTNVNLKAPFFLTQALLPQLRAAARADDPARIINIGSGHGIRVSRFEAFAYHATKAGVHHLTRSLATRLARENITVNAVAPGVFPSRITAEFSAEQVAAIEASVPLGRYGCADDVAGTLIFLCSAAGRYVSGTVLPVDGGWVGCG